MELSTALSAALAAYDQREKMAPYLRKLHLRIKHGEVNIVFFGTGGTGKTTLGRFLGGTLETGSLARDYQESIDLETIRLAGDLTGSLLIPPGQVRRTDSWTKLYQLLATGKSRGVINVVSWGLHSFSGLAFEETNVFAPGMSSDVFIERWAEQGRVREIDFLGAIHDRVVDAPNDLWMITFVAKEDLWWPERIAVNTHYREGEYGQVIKSIEQKRGAAHFRHEFMSAAVVTQNFRSGTGQLLLPTAAGYDDELRYGRLRRMAESVDILARRL
jgi:hypothetical protein